jgi:hypothetical protein
VNPLSTCVNAALEEMDMNTHEQDHTNHVHGHGQSLNRVALMATIHCLTGCAIGEVAGMVIGTALGWGNAQTIILAVVLAFTTGYAFTMIPLLRAGMALKRALRLALASDTISVSIMEIVDNLIMLVIPGAMDAKLSEPLFWGSLFFALAVAGVAAYPANRWLIARGKGHAVVHAHHAH